MASMRTAAVIVVLTALMFVHVFICAALCISGTSLNDVSPIHAYSWVGAVLFQPGMLACWSVLASRRLAFRLAVSLILIGWFVVAHFWGASLNVGGAVAPSDLFGFGVQMFLGVYVASAMLLLILRQLWQWRLVSPLDAASGNHATRRTASRIGVYTSRELMLFIAAAALPLAALGYLLRDVVIVHLNGSTWGSTTEFFGVAVMGAICAPLLAFLLGVVLATRDRRRFLVGTAVYLGLFSAAVLLLPMTMGVPLAGAIVPLCLAAGYCVAAVISFWVLRRCGYRLHTTSSDGRVTNAGSTRDRSFGGSAVAPLGALGLVFALLLAPAFQLADFRERHAQEFAWRRRGVAVALADGAVVRAEFWNRGANRTALADEVLAALVDERTLVELDLSQTAVSDEQLDIICRGDNVYKLSLTGTSISDAGLEAVAKMKSVQYLDLTGTSVTDVGIAKLNELTSLKHLILGPSMQVTSAGIEAMQRALPDCDIHFFGGALPARAVDPQDVSNAAADGF